MERVHGAVALGFEKDAGDKGQGEHGGPTRASRDTGPTAWSHRATNIH